MKQLKTSTLLFAAGGVCLLIFLVIIYNHPGKEVVCNVNVDATLLGSLDINSATCHTGASCNTVLAQISPLSIFDLPGTQRGSLAFVVTGVELESTSIKENSFAPTGTTYPIGACVPVSVTNARVVAKNAAGGEDDAIGVTFT